LSTADKQTFQATAQRRCKTESRTVFCIYCQKGQSQWHQRTAR